MVRPSIRLTHPNISLETATLEAASAFFIDHSRGGIQVAAIPQFHLCAILSTYLERNFSPYDNIPFREVEDLYKLIKNPQLEGYFLKLILVNNRWRLSNKCWRPCNYANQLLGMGRLPKWNSY